MKFWQSMFLCEGDQFLDAAEIIEEVGFNGVAVPDHLVHMENFEPAYPYSGDGQPPQFSEKTAWPDCWTLAAALGQRTRTLEFVSNVYIVPLRHPVELAKSLATAAYFNNGRVALGAGAGWMKEEFEMMGQDFHTRGKRFNDAIEIMRKLWTGEIVEHHSDYYDIPRLSINPVPAQPIPIYIGGSSKAALRRAARVGDGWIGPGQTAGDAVAMVGQINALRTEYGRANEPFHFIVPIYSDTTNDIDDIQRLVDAGVDGIMSLPFAFNIGPDSTLDQKRAYLENYAETVITKVRG